MSGRSLPIGSCFYYYFVFLVCENQHLIEGTEFWDEREGKSDQFCQILLYFLYFSTTLEEDDGR